MTTRPDIRRLVGILLAAVYAVPLWLPPEAQTVYPPLPDASWLDRLFPGVPGAWIVGRLACLFAGAALLAWPGMVDRPHWQPPTGAGAAYSRGALRVALAIAVATALAAPFAAQWQRPMQLAFAAALPLPPLIMWLAIRRPRRARLRPSTAAAAAVLAAWIALVVPWSWRSPWIANIADNLGPLNMVHVANDPSFNFLVDTVRPAQTGLFLLLEGGAWLAALGIGTSVTTVQALNFVWIGVTALLLARLAARCIAPMAAPVAAAFFLFSPSAQMMTLLLGPLFVGPLLGGGVLLALEGVRKHGSVPASLTAAALIGFCATFPSMTPFASLTALAWGWLAWGRRMPLAAIVAGGCSGLALVLPGLPSMLALREVVDFYATTSGQWSTLEAASFGWLDPERVRLQLMAGWSGPFDPLLGSLALPFALPRTAMRMLGDVLYDPIGTVLATVGMFHCVFARRPLPLMLIGLLGLSLGGGLLPGYDRVSAMRLILLPLPMTLLAATGAVVLLHDTHPRRLAWLAAAIVLSGSWLGRVVQPSILPQSIVGMAIELQSANPSSPLLVLLPRGVDMSGGMVFFDQVPSPPIGWLAYDDPNQLPDAGAPVDRWLWSPGLEERSPVAIHACARDAVVFAISDRSGTSRVYLAQARERGAPTLPAGFELQRRECGLALDTERQRSERALREAAAMQADAAIESLRQVARHSFTAFEVYDALAQALRQRQAAGDLDEARRWAERAVRMCGSCRRDHVATLAAVQRARGDARAAEDSEAAASRAASFCFANFRLGHPCRPET